MNQQLAKVSQRQIRRALGHEANAMLNAHAEAMKIINQDMAAQKQAFDALEKDVQALIDDCYLTFPVDRTALGRLKWLVFGR